MDAVSSRQVRIEVCSTGSYETTQLHETHVWKLVLVQNNVLRNCQAVSIYLHRFSKAVTEFNWLVSSCIGNKLLQHKLLIQPQILTWEKCNFLLFLTLLQKLTFLKFWFWFCISQHVLRLETYRFGFSIWNVCKLSPWAYSIPANGPFLLQTALHIHLVLQCDKIKK